MIAAISARTLIATLCLLALATSASAECAWVLWAGYWGGSTRDQPHVDWTAAGGYAVQAECNRARDLRNKNPNKAFLIDFVCLPDTVDPRGPKGK